jgi:very-short-patch-repair endonuclease
MPEALGALARAKCAVVIGDSKQLRPASGLPSILDICVGARLPELRLGTHYRSKHEDLIAFAADHFYDKRLTVFPAAFAQPDFGISWRKVDAEAEAIVADVLARLRDSQQCSRSIGIVTFSREQQSCIEDLLEEARAADPAIALEPLVVAHVDAMQGEERDVVLVWLDRNIDARQLCVATTCAREQLVLVSSFGPEDVENKDLAGMLAFAAAGGGASKQAPDVEPKPASPITAAIARALADRGWTIRHGVGCGAFKIDLAVVDPNDSDRYVLAIEHDGMAYASAHAARDRDRLRAQVLSQLGWRLHRVWSLDWWTDPEREIQRAHGAIVTAVAASRNRRAQPSSTIHAPRPAAPPRPRAIRASRPPMTVQIPPLAETAAPDAIAAALDTVPQLASGSAPVRIARGAIPIGPYTVAAIPAGRRAPDDLFAPRYLPELGKVVEQVLAAEAPMTIDLLARRVGSYFGIGRVSPRVTDQVRIALTGRGRWGEEDNVVWRMDQDPAGVPPVRVAGTGPAARREIDEVPLSELAAAARIVVERAPNIQPSDLVRDAARLLGFARITSQVTDRIVLGVQLALQRTLITLEDGRARLPE